MLDSKRILINRNGAFGDMIHMSHLPRLLKDQGWKFVGVVTGYKGEKILANNPFVDQMHYFEFAGVGVEPHYYASRLRHIAQQYDALIDLLHTLEVGALALEGQNVYFQHQKQRDKMGKRNYYDIATEMAGYPDLIGKYKGEMFFTDEEVRIVKHDLLREGRFKDNFRVMINLSGSSAHKHFMYAEEIATWILNTYPDAVIFLTGDKTVSEFEFGKDNPRIRSIVDKKKFRQAALMMKYMHCAIGAESGIMCAATMWEIPTVQLMTAASIYNHCKYNPNDLSLQSPARCSPCFKGPYNYYGCPKQGEYPLCVYFDVAKIKEQVSKAYEMRSASKEVLSEVPVLQ
jgi:ADP-heptose:LPS heptosyltransferase